MPRGELDACTSRLSVHKFPFLEFSPSLTVAILHLVSRRTNVHVFPFLEFPGDCS